MSINKEVDCSALVKRPASVLTTEPMFCLLDIGRLLSERAKENCFSAVAFKDA